MRLDDARLDRLRRVLDEPDLAGTRYRLIGPLGRGGMGSVWHVEDVLLGRRVALKVLAVPDDHGTLAARLLDEARILAALEHPGIIPVHDAGTLGDGRVFYVMKRVRGRGLDRAAAELSLHETLAIFTRVCDAVAFAHASGVLHRDLKPSNIMLGEFGVALVLDWGVAKRVAEPIAPPAETHAPAPAATSREAADPAPASRKPADPASASRKPPARAPALPARTAAGHPSPNAMTAAGTRIGTAGYMAPEQESGESVRIGPATDVYGLGRVLGFLVERATTAPPPIQRRPLSEIIAKATAFEPAHRYANAGELGEDVRRLMAGESVAAYPEGPLRRARRALVPHTTAIVLVATYVLLRAVLILAGQ